MTLVTPRVGSPLLALAVALMSAACSGSADPLPVQPAPVPTSDPDRAKGPAKVDTGGIGAPNIAWKDKTRSQRQDYMGIFVLPKMQELFKGWNPDEFSEDNSFRCQNCHGEGFDKPDVDFHMPKVAFPLKADDPVGGAMSYDQEAASFMTDRVLPAMAELFGEAPDPTGTNGGFSCFRCHPAKGAK